MNSLDVSRGICSRPDPVLHRKSHGLMGRFFGGFTCDLRGMKFSQLATFDSQAESSSTSALGSLSFS